MRGSACPGGGARGVSPRGAATGPVRRGSIRAMVAATSLMLAAASAVTTMSSLLPDGRARVSFSRTSAPYPVRATRVDGDRSPSPSRWTTGYGAEGRMAGEPEPSWTDRGGTVSDLVLKLDELVQLRDDLDAVVREFQNADDFSDSVAAGARHPHPPPHRPGLRRPAQSRPGLRAQVEREAQGDDREREERPAGHRRRRRQLRQGGWRPR